MPSRRWLVPFDRSAAWACAGSRHLLSRTGGTRAAHWAVFSRAAGAAALACAAGAVLLAYPAAAGAQQSAGGVAVELSGSRAGEGRLLRILPVTDAIVRVTVAPGTAFSTRPSLIVPRVQRRRPVTWKHREAGDDVVVSTSRLKVAVNRRTGRVVFMDHGGRVLLAEPSGGGRRIVPVKVRGERAYRILQLFDSPPDEAFYGLGQHQNGVLDWKGHAVDLWQYNSVVSLPFVVSGRGYGILWDNTSHTHFGDPRAFRSLSRFRLLDAAGEPGALTAEYFRDRDFRRPLTTLREADVAHEYTDRPGSYPAGFDPSRGSIRWSGALVADSAGTYTLRLYSSGYARLRLGGRLVVDTWRQNWHPWTDFVRVRLKAGRSVPIVLEWIPEGGYIGLRALTPEPARTAGRLALSSDVADQIDYYFIRGTGHAGDLDAATAAPDAATSATTAGASGAKAAPRASRATGSPGRLDAVIAGYRELTGQAPMVPRWALGLWQSRERYQTQAQLLGVVREFRRRSIPLDVIVQDWFYWPEDRWGSHDFDATRYPSPAAMVDTLHRELHTRIMLSVWPKFYVGTANYRALADSGWVYTHKVEQRERDWVGQGHVSTFYDAFNPAARRLYFDQLRRKLVGLGFDAWWMDATEPDMGDVPSPAERLARMNPTALGPAERAENAYPLVHAGGVYQGLRAAVPDRRVLILTRSAYAGQQRYGTAVWSGDVASRWEALRAQIPAGLDFSLSGMPYWTTDIGGFAVERRYEHPDSADLEEWRELMTRWFQFGAFSPIFRVHGQFPYREPFNVAPPAHPAYRAMLAYDRLRYRMLPYLYSLAGSVTQDGSTIMRALPMDFPDDPRVRDLADEYMLGPALLVAPVTAHRARSRPVYLPTDATASGWYELRSGRYLAGGRTIRADAPYSDIPVFARAGAILPWGPALQYTDEKPADPIRLYVYAGRDGVFTLYEDDGGSYAYEHGAFSRIPLRWDDRTRTLAIGARRGNFPGMPRRRTFEIVWVRPGHPVGLDFRRPPDRVVSYEGAEVKVRQ